MEQTHTLNLILSNKINKTSIGLKYLLMVNIRDTSKIREEKNFLVNLN